MNILKHQSDLGFNYVLSDKEKEILNKYKTGQKRPVSVIDIEEVNHDNHEMLDKCSMKREPLRKRRRVNKEGKQPRFTWCQSRQQMVVKEAISEELFSKVESCHSEVAQIISNPYIGAAL